MSGSSLREGFLIDSRRLQAFSRTWEKKGSSVRERALVCLWRKLASHVSHCVLLRRTTEAFHATEEMAFPYNSCDPGRRGTCSQPGSRPRPRHSSSLLKAPVHQEDICVLQLDAGFYCPGPVPASSCSSI